MTPSVTPTSERKVVEVSSRTVATHPLAVIGTGHIGMRHLEVLRGLGGVEPVAIPVRPERLSELQQAGYATARDLDEAVRRGVRFCIIATDTGRHVVDVHAALAHGFDVLVEKPLAVNAADAKRLCDEAARVGRKVYVGCVMRFSESLNTFREWLDEVGRLHAVRIECQSYLPDWRPQRFYRDSYAARPREGGVLLDLIHEIDYAGWIFGWPDAVHARLQNLGRLGIAAEEMVEMSWETPTGCRVSIALDYLTRPARRSMRAHGEGGTIEWDGMANTVSLWLTGEPARQRASLQTHNEMFAAQARAAIAVHEGSAARAPRLATAEEGLSALAVCDAARRSSDLGRSVQVSYP